MYHSERLGAGSQALDRSTKEVGYRQQCGSRTGIRGLRLELGDDANNLTYVFTELRVGNRMPRGEQSVEEEA